LTIIARLAAKLDSVVSERHFGRMILRFIGVASVMTTLVACATPPPLILVSLDGFRHDYCALHPAETPVLRQLQQEGVTARALIPVFPSNTFPNHYSLVTGRYPVNHGILNNDFFDTESGAYFHSSVSTVMRHPRWWGGEPIWITAMKQQRPAAASFWVGSEAEIQGKHPTYWRLFDLQLTFEKRLEEVIGWLKLPENQRPAFVAIYLEETNSTAHNFGPDSPALVAAVKLQDQRIGMLRDRLAQEGISANLVVVSDHGMTAVDAQQVVFLDDYLDLSTVQVDFQGSVAGFRPLQGTAEALLEQLRRLPHASAYRREELPARFHMDAGPRVPPVWVLPAEGWSVMTRAGMAKYRGRVAGASYLRGDHGYDPALPSMHGIFIASGPSFQRGKLIPPVENIHVYNLLCAALGLTPAQNDGDDRLVKAALR
jgi:predicted AlkP superfamily pyrophosphatase or phosphodiesterase